tara:strand:- start:1305 stop:1919 length:615 start_codon:yes stop_codon:yes gene_type:complete
MEEKYVQNIYEEIAIRFNHTRAYYWKGIKDFLLNLDKHSFILDAGCGNGKHMLLRKDCFFVGQDFCCNSMRICKKKGLNVIINNIKKLSFRSNIFNATICVAVLHHLESIENRIKAIQELSRVTKPNGLIFIQVWATEAVDPKKFIQIEGNDYFVTWYVNKDRKVKRYYHLFERNELLDLCKQCKIDILNIYFEFNNWILVGKK